MTEREFIIQLAVNSFNAQYNASIRLSECDAKSIQPNGYSAIAYEVYTVRQDDNVRIRLYLNFGHHDRMGEYRLEVDGSDAVGRLGDEVYVALGFVDVFYRDSGLYKFHWMGVDLTSWNIFITEDGQPFINEETGEYFLTETGA